MEFKWCASGRPNWLDDDTCQSIFKVILWKFWYLCVTLQFHKNKTLLNVAAGNRKQHFHRCLLNWVRHYDDNDSANTISMFNLFQMESFHPYLCYIGNKEDHFEHFESLLKTCCLCLFIFLYFGAWIKNLSIVTFKLNVLLYFGYKQCSDKWNVCVCVC